MIKINQQFLFIYLCCIAVVGMGFLIAQSDLLKSADEKTDSTSQKITSGEANKKSHKSSSKKNESTAKIDLPRSNKITYLTNSVNPTIPINSPTKKISPRQTEKAFLKKALTRDDSYVTVEKLDDGTEIIHYNGSFQHVSSAFIDENGEAHVECDHSHDHTTENPSVSQAPKTFIK